MRKTGVLRAHPESIRNFRTEVARGSARSTRWRTESFRPNAFPGADLIIRECDRVTGQSSSGHESTFVHQAKGLHVEGLRCDPGIGHVQLVGAQRLRRRGVGGTVQETGEILDGADVRFLGFIAHAPDAHVFDHPGPQRGGSFLRLGNRLSDDGKPPIVRQKGPQPNAPRSAHCRTPAKGASAAERLRPRAEHLYEATTNVRAGSGRTVASQMRQQRESYRSCLLE